MAIGLSGSDIQIDTGIASGTATSATSTTLVDTGATFTGYATKIVYIIGGTGVGQSRAIKSSTATTLTIYGTWLTIPDNTSTYVITYDVTDVEAAIAGATWQGPAANKNLQFGGSIRVVDGGAFGGLKNHITLTTDRTSFRCTGTGFIQMGREEGDDYGVEGGSITQSNQTTSYFDLAITGIWRLFGCDWTSHMQSVPAGTNCLTTINDFQSAAEMTMKSCNITDVWINETAGSTFVNNNFFSTRAGFPTRSSGVRSEKNKIYSGILSPRASNGTVNGADAFDLEYIGDPPDDPYFSTPVYLYLFNLPTGVFYYWNTKFPVPYSQIFKWQNNVGNGRIYEGYSVLIDMQDANGPLEGVKLYLEDNAGNPGWTVDKNGSNYFPVKQGILTTDSNGTVVNNNIGNGESALVIRSMWERSSESVSSSTDYYPLKLNARKFGFVYTSKTVDYTERSIEQQGFLPNTGLTELSTTVVGAYTELETANKLYNYDQYYLFLDANAATEEIYSISGNQIVIDDLDLIHDATAGSLYVRTATEVTVKASTFLGGVSATTATYTARNGTLLLGGVFDCDVNYDSGASTTITNVTCTGTFDFTIAGTYTVVGCNFTEITNSSGGAVILNASNTSITTNTGPNITINNTVFITADVSDINGSPIENARVFIKAAAGGPETVGTELVNALTDVNGQVSVPYNYTANQPVTGWVRKASSAPFYKESPIAGTITASGFPTSPVMLLDQ